MHEEQSADSLLKERKIVYICKKKDMKTLSIAISDIEYGRFSIPSEQLNFTDFIDIIGRELMRQNFNRCVASAEKYGLSSMTMEEITNEVNAVRRNAKSSY